MITIKCFPAGAGDCFLLTIEGKGKTNILIDGGFKKTANQFLIPELQKLGKAGEVLDLIIATHSDLDHIGGLIYFLQLNGKADVPKIIPVKEIWFNGYKHLISLEKTRNLSEEEVYKMKEVIADCKKYLKPDLEDQLISLEKAASLAKLLTENGYSWNKATEGQAIKSETLPQFELNNDILIRVISPDNSKIDLLSSEWQDELLSRGLGSKPFSNADLLEEALEVWEMAIAENEEEEGPIAITTDFETMLQQAQLQKFKEDESPANGSSIALILEVGGKRILFSGDAHPSQLIQGLKNIYGSSIPIFDMVKLPHHGAFGCNSKELIETAQSRAYLISTNGEHERYSHPSWSPLAHIILRENKLPCTLIFNYRDNPILKEMECHQAFLKTRKTKIKGLENPFEIKYE